MLNPLRLKLCTEPENVPWQRNAPDESPQEKDYEENPAPKKKLNSRVIDIGRDGKGRNCNADDSKRANTHSTFLICTGQE